eukprot:CAMPEP_0180671908 /NCGR_PEP_ID=MMETSP1037_2-20121125/64840_1 /TAXON_ID=632150 /ORGANISM="Azadinium spinosum, Strain 3D9" /LENGTH=52 /DNA_ID=CAMNT_0022700997 /DNA_START=34 /DNA_END=189 /DNA_ORIENTATION=-
MSPTSSPSPSRVAKAHTQQMPQAELPRRTRASNCKAKTGPEEARPSAAGGGS